MKEVFSSIYKNKKWLDVVGTESGPGSSIECSQSYLQFLDTFVKQHEIKSILDLGCGDLNLMKHFDFSSLYYKGIDIVDCVIQTNIERYKRENVEFETSSITDYDFNVPFDLIICKDVLQHLSSTNVLKILGKIKNFKYSLFTNDFDETNFNNPILDGDYTAIDLKNSPYNALGEYVFEWKSFIFLKRTFLILNRFNNSSL